MSAAILVALYVVALTGFLGLVILPRVPPTLYATVVATLGAVVAVGGLGGLYMTTLAAKSSVRFDHAVTLGGLASALGAAAGAGSLAALGRLLLTSPTKN